MVWKIRIQQALRFVASSLGATLTHWLLMLVLIVTGMIPAWATAIGALAGAMVNYLLQYRFTFACSAAHGPVLLRYLLVCVVTWCANLGIFLVLYPTIIISPVFAQGVTTFAVALLSFLLYKKAVFHDRTPQAVLP